MITQALSTNGFRVSVATDPPGTSEVPGMQHARIAIHAGPPVMVACRRGGSQHRGTAVHGDIDIIPAHIPSYWQVSAYDTFLTLSVFPELLDRVAQEFDIDPQRLEILNLFQLRDPQLENIGWALKAEMEAGFPCGSLYFDSLAVSVAARLVRCYSSMPAKFGRQNGKLPGRRLKEVLSYIEGNLGQNITLAEIAAVAGFSLSHFKSLFRQTVGVPVHQYVIRRRLEHARTLLGESKLSISEIALETGFASQSHLSRHMRRVLGVSPKMLRESIR